MKIGCCVGMGAQDANKIGADRIEILARLGYDYVELPMARMMALSDRGFADLVLTVERSGLPCLAVSSYFPTDMRITGPTPTDRDDIKAYISKSLDRATRLGAQTAVFGSGWARNIPEGYSYQAAWTQLIDVFRMADDLIGGRDITIAIEPLNKKESNIILTMAEGLTLAKDIARPRVGLLSDYYHQILENESMEIIAEAAGYLQHAHIANPAERVWPKVGDGVDYRSFLGALQSAGYSGGVSVEAFTNDFENDAREALSVLRGNIM